MQAGFVLGALVTGGVLQLMKAMKERKEKTLSPIAMNALSRTACRMAAGRALCKVSPDPLAEMLAGPEMIKIQNDVYIQWSGRVMQVRHLWFNSRIEAAIATGRIQQVVLLGSGMDARAYYLKGLAGCSLYELDVAEIFDYKESVLAANRDKVPPLIPAQLKYVRAQLENPNWIDSLLKAGFHTDKPAVWVLEGLTYYLTEEEAKTLMTTIQSHTTPDSVLLADILSESPPRKENPPRKELTVPESAKWPDFKFATPWPEKWLPELGFTDVVVKQFGEPGADFDFVDWSITSNNGWAAFPFRVPREITEDTYGRRITRLLLTEAKVGAPLPEAGP